MFLKVYFNMAPKKSTIRVITLGGTGKGKGKYLKARTQRININITMTPKHDDIPIHIPPALPLPAEADHLTDSIGQASKCTYQSRKQRARESWDNVRQATFAVACSLEAPSDSVAICSVCSSTTDELIRCRDCGAYTIYCKACERDAHSQVLHKPEIWSVCLHIIIII